MNTSSKAASEARKGKSVWLALIGLGLLFAAVGFGWIFNESKTPNYAKEVAAPLEKRITAAGGVKKCTNGDNGRGSDNNRPWYDSTFSFPAGYSDASAQMKKIASDAGYSLRQATPSDKGPLSGIVNDEYLQSWSFDITSKASQYADLTGGSVELVVGVNASGAKDVCGEGKNILVDGSHSVISVRTKLPEYRK